MYQLFKGYVPTKGKRCTVSFKGKSSDELMTLEEISSADEFAGILNDNTVLIDVDDHDQSEILMKIVEEKQLACRVYETTRGKHFLFLNDGAIEKNWTGQTTAIGLTCDCKIGSRSSYSVLKYKGFHRQIIYDIYSDENYQPVPRWLIPVKNIKDDWINMGDGDGRNQGLFNYILTLQGSGYTKQEVTECIQIINQYVLKKPLDPKELETILRDESFQKPVFYDGKTFLHDKFGQFLISEHNIIKIGNVLHYFKNGVYVPTNIDSIMIKHIPNLKQQQRREVESFIMAYIDHNTQVSPANYIAFRNGVYDLDQEKLEPFSESMVLTNKINWNYNPNAYSKLADDVLNRLACQDPKIRSLLDELIGYCFYRRNELRKAFMLKGERHNGKSTFLDMLQYLLGEDNISSLDLSDLGHEYKASGLFGKLANLGDDIEDEFIPSAGIFKKVCSGDRMNANVKYGQPIEFNPYCKLIFSGNTIPRLGKGRDSEAIIDRLIIVPFNASFNKNTADFSPFIKYQLRSEECMEYLIRIGLDGLQRVLRNNAFTTAEKVEKELIEYTETLNPILSFFDEYGETLENEPTKKCYRLYDQFCFENSMKPISHIEFSKAVKKHLGYDIKLVRFEGKPTKIFIKAGEDG